MKVLADRTFRIGRQRLLWNPLTGRYFAAIHNRTYDSMHEVPLEAAKRWYRALLPDLEEEY